MPVADENLAEKLPFDVYAMMLILSFVLLGVAIWLLQDELATNWFSAQEGRKCAVYLTKNNEKTDVYKDDIHVDAKEDLEDYKAITATEDKPARYLEYPSWMQTRRIDTSAGVDNTQGVPEAELEQLKKSYEDPLATPDDSDKKAEAAPAPAPAPAATP